MAPRRGLARRLSRRSILAGSALALIGRRARGTTSSGPAAESTLAQRWPWPFDADGDGHLGTADRAIVAAALGRRRGAGIASLPGWDHRADVLATGAVTASDLAAWEALAAAVPPVALPPRPLVTCFHYGWYRTARRGGSATMRYRGGHYVSASRRTEEEFNRLKHEFGISADLLSWIEQPSNRTAFERGYLAAASLRERRFGFLYETVINLEARGRLAFRRSPELARRLAAGFAAMGEWASRAVGERGARPLAPGGRPVVYLFASHLFGDTRDDLPAVGEALAAARDAFARAFGRPPFLIGDESPFPADGGVAFDRAYRARWFDAVTRYHHYDEREIRGLAGGSPAVRLDAEHRARIVANEQRAIDGFRGVRNEFTGAPLLVVPSSAAGFAKQDMPALRATGEEYRALLADIQSLTDRHLAHDHAGRLGTAELPAALVLVGSWNEEFEGHALMPAAANEALVESGQDGFEWLRAIRGLYGWNHHASVSS